MKLFSTITGIMLGFVFVFVIFLLLHTNVVTALSGITGGLGGHDFEGQEKWYAYFYSIFCSVFIGLPTLMGMLYYYLAQYFLLQDKKKLISLLAVSFTGPLIPILILILSNAHYSIYIILLLSIFLMLFSGAVSYTIAKRFVPFRESDNRARAIVVDNALKTITTIFGICIGIFLVVLFSRLFLSGIVTAFTGINGNIFYTNLKSQWGVYFASFFFPLLILVSTLTGFSYFRMAKYSIKKHNKKLIILFILVLSCIAMIVLLWSLKFFIA